MPTSKPLATSGRLPFDGVNVQAFVTHLAGVGRIAHHDLNPCSQSFVVDKQPQLVKCPTVRPPTLSFVAGLLVDALTDACQIFQRNAGLFRLGSLNKTFRAMVIQPGLKSTLTTRQPLQQFTHSTACTACALTGFVLQLRPQVGQWSRTLVMSCPSQCSPADVCAISVRPKSTPKTPLLSCDSGGSGSRQIWR